MDAMKQMGGKLRMALRWSRGLGLLLLVSLAWFIDWKSFAAILGKVDVAFISGYVALFLLALAVRVARLQVVLARHGHKLPWRRLYAFTVEASFLGIVTPGRLGEMVKVGYLAESSVPFSLSLILVTLEKAFDFLLPALLGVVGAVYFLGLLLSPANALEWAGFGGVAAFAGFLAGMAFLGKWLHFLPPAPSRWIPSLLASRWSDFQSSLPLAWERSSKPLAAYSAVLLSLNVGQIYLLARAIGINQANFIELGFAYAASAVIAVIPVSISGLGTREVSYVFLLSQVGVDAEHALMLSLFDGVFFPIVATLFLAVPLWLAGAVRSPLVDKRKFEQK